MTLILLKGRHWKLVWVTILAGILAAHFFFSQLGQPRTADHTPGGRRVKPLKVPVRPDMPNSSKDGLLIDALDLVNDDVIPAANRHGQSGDKDKVTNQDDILVGAGPYLVHDDDNGNKRNRNNKIETNQGKANQREAVYEFDIEDEDAFDDNNIDENDDIVAENKLVNDKYAREIVQSFDVDEKNNKEEYIFDDDDDDDDGDNGADDDILTENEPVDNLDEDAKEGQEFSKGDFHVESHEKSEENPQNKEDKSHHSRLSYEDESYFDKGKGEVKPDARLTNEHKDILSDNEKTQPESSTATHPVQVVEEARRPSRGRHVTKLILLTYMRSGSSYVGSLLEQSPEVFYFYEPLFSVQKNFGHWDKFKYLDGHTISESFNADTSAQKIQTRSAPEAYYLPTSVAVTTLKSTLDCSLHDLDLESLGQATMNLSPSTWQLTKCASSELAGDNIRARQCYDNISAICREAVTVGAKVIRLSMKQARALMVADADVRLVHLIRDPRGMFLSQIFRRFYPREFTQQTISFCARIWRDIQDHLTLSQDFPGRTLLVRYEDIVHSPSEAVQQIYDFAGIQFHPTLRKQTLRMSRDKNRPYAWREKIGAERAATVEQNCVTVLHTMGYREFPDEESVTDRSFMTVKDNFAQGWPGGVVRIEAQYF